MDIKCLDYCLTEAERKAFEQDGYFIVENALDPDHIDKLIEVTNRLENDLNLYGRFHDTKKTLVNISEKNKRSTSS